MPAFFITATGTDIGKSFIACAMAYWGGQCGTPWQVAKPVLSGFDQAQMETSDSGQLLEAMGIPCALEAIARISPWRYAAPLAPNMAAQKEGRKLPYAELLAWCSAWVSQHEYALIEGVGGVMVPLDSVHTVRDWIADMRLPAILVTGNYLGSISHTLTAAEALMSREIPIARIVVSESENSTVSMEDTLATLREFLPAGISMVAIPRAQSYRDAIIGSLFKQDWA